MKGKSGCLERIAGPAFSLNFQGDVLSYYKKTLPQTGLTCGALSRFPLSSASLVARSVSAKGGRRAVGLSDEP